MLTPKKIATFGPKNGRRTCVPVGLGTRLAALSMEISCAYFLAFFFSPERNLLDILGSLAAPVLKDLELFNFQLPSLLGLYLLTQLLRFISQLFFGHGPFDPLFGMTDTQGFWGSRILGGLKVILDTVLFPFLIFHLPLLKAQQTPVEAWASYQKWQEVSPGPFGHLGVFMAPFVVLLSLFSPLMMGLTLFDGVQIREEKPPETPKPRAQDLASFEIYNSELLRLKTLSSLDQGRFILMPQFNLSRKEGQLKLGPYLLIFDQRERVFLELKLKATLRMGALIEKSQNGVPLWDQSFPKLANSYRLLNKNQRQGERAFLFTGQKCEELQQLVRSSFSLGPGTLVDHTFNYGPFLKGFVDLRRSLLSVVGPEIPPEVDFVELGDTEFLRFRQLYDLPQRTMAVEQTFLPPCVTRAPVYVLKSDSDMPSAVSRQDFLSAFFQQAEWFFGESEDENLNPLPNRPEQMNVFHLLDHAQWDGLGPKEKKVMESSLADYYFRLGEQTLELSQKNKKLKREFQRSLKRMIELLELYRKKERTLMDSGLIEYLKQTLQAYKNLNLSYFGLEEGSRRTLWER